jgi:hypothetical protein
MPTKTFSFSLKEDPISERRTSIVDVALFRRPDRDETPVTVKWFNDKKGFGFLC